MDHVVKGSSGNLPQEGKLRVLQLITLSETGGAQKVVYELIRGLTDRRRKNVPADDVMVEYEVLLACKDSGALIEWVRESCPEVSIVPLRYMRREIHPLIDLRAFWELRQLIRCFRPHIVHCHSSKAGILGRLAAFFTHVPVTIFTVHGWSFYGMSGLSQRFFVVLEKWMAQITNAIVCVSKRDVEEGISRTILPSRHELQISESGASSLRAKVIHNGLPLGNGEDGKTGNLAKQQNELVREAIAKHAVATASPDLKQLSTDFEKERPFIVITVGRLAKAKDPWLFLDLVEKCANENPDDLLNRVHFFWVGDGPLYEEMKSEICKRNLDGWVTLLGERQDILSLLKQADVFLLTSCMEAFPIAILEAMKVGLPILSVEVGGVREQVESGVTGQIVPSREPDVLWKELKMLLCDAEKRQRYGVASQTRFQRYFSVDKMLQEYEELYRESLTNIGS
ncbi:glycosyltransferase [Heliobacterium gestii]|uniref:Glycosyltransferase n=1 Tax=Heliomicrobium gestii TaxID=2699 RepID=A0A845LCN6_HELGE|nr:glycosyltransferase family 4 protein [Heliomicrobium gestii]MBM7866596.1 glycosyltransferase involved in cell wall biosynthesis [Heliomicrobium gestii]MZP43124.1 glycosyltransferase [Heliomicrobium gestii]